jgi:hypothetical protein
VKTGWRIPALVPQWQNRSVRVLPRLRRSCEKAAAAARMSLKLKVAGFVSFMEDQAWGRDVRSDLFHCHR